MGGHDRPCLFFDKNSGVALYNERSNKSSRVLVSANAGTASRLLPDLTTADKAEPKSRSAFGFGL